MHYILKGKSLKIAIDLYCLMPPIWIIYSNDPWSITSKRVLDTNSPIHKIIESTSSAEVFSWANSTFFLIQPRNRWKLSRWGKKNTAVFHTFFGKKKTHLLCFSSQSCGKCLVVEPLRWPVHMWWSLTKWPWKNLKKLVNQQAYEPNLGKRSYSLMIGCTRIFQHLPSSGFKETLNQPSSCSCCTHLRSVHRLRWFLEFHHQCFFFLCKFGLSGIAQVDRRSPLRGLFMKMHHFQN